MSILIVNHTVDKTFTFTFKKKLFTLLPGSKNIVIETDLCPPELSKLRATGEVFVSVITDTTLDFYKSLPTATVKEDKTPKKIKTNEKEL